MDRSPSDPCFVASSFVIRIQNRYVMYYLSCFNWEETPDGLKHYYNLKIATSNDGFTWHPTGKTAIDLKQPDEYAISVPRVLFEDGIYKMWYSCRASANNPNYRIGYAESSDGFEWNRKDELITFNPSSQPWNTEMQCYPCIFDYRENRFMLYNGNGYGKTGFGIAILEK
jgi:predicted GH43/DUF377 family glycosyl hydrolase